MTDPSDDPTGERADAVRNRARLLEAAARLVAERGAEHVTMHEVSQVAGVGKGTLWPCWTTSRRSSTRRTPWAHRRWVRGHRRRTG